MSSSSVPRTRRLRGATAFVGVAFYLALLVGQAPHLVHHLFEHGARSTECPLATNCERTAGAVVAVVTVVPAVQVAALPMPEAVPAVRHADHALPDSRAPPRLPS